MIKNAREYQITKAQAARFEKALETPAPSSALDKIRFDAARAQLSDLRAELADYEALTSGKRTVVEVEDLAELPRALIQARIAAGLSQRELAERLGLKEQQIQRYEATNYAAAGLTRLLDIVRALDVRVRQDVVFPSADVSAKALTTSLEGLGFDRTFVTKRMFLDTEESDGAWRSTVAASRVLGVPMTNLVRGELNLAGTPAMFKLPRGASSSKLLAYSFYARYLAERIAVCVPEVEAKPLLKRPSAVFRTLRDEYGGVNFRAALDFCWDRGLVVIPLRDTGAFHGAFWRFGNRGVVVLKHSTRSSDRWLLDLLHEYQHAVQTEREEDVELLELAESPFDRLDSEIEKVAVAWATAAALDEREQELTQACIDEADGHVPRLKRVVRRLARREEVPQGVLADYLAHRLARSSDEDWWATATSLQPTEEGPYDVALSVLLPRLELQRVDQLDRDLITRAFVWEGRHE